jgi:hypothetical protein
VNEFSQQNRGRLTSTHCASNKLPALAGLALNADYFLQIPKEHNSCMFDKLQACSEGLPLSKELGHTFRRLTAAWTKVITNDEVPRVTPPRTRNVQAVAAPARSRGLMLGPELSSFSRLLSECTLSWFGIYSISSPLRFGPSTPDTLPFHATQCV